MRKVLLVVALVFSFLFQAGATDGYLSSGYGPISKGLAGAGIGLPITSLVNGNPAANVWVGSKQWNVSASLFSPIRRFNVFGSPSGQPGTFGLQPGKVESNSNQFVIPSVSVHLPLKNNGENLYGNSSLTVSVFGHGGMNTNYPTSVFYDSGSSTTGVDLKQAFVGITYSRQVSENHSFGITPLFAVQLFEMNGVGSFAPFSSDPSALSNNGVDASVGFGVKLGYFGFISDYFSVGASYQTKTITSNFDKYSGLFADQGGFDIPASLTAGFAFSPEDGVVLAFDFRRIFYGGIGSVSNPMLSSTGFTPLGSTNGSGFGWKSINVYKVGLQKEFSESFTLRTGISFGQQPIPKSEVLFNILAPGVIQSHMSFGGTINSNLHLSFVYSPQGRVKGINPLDPAQEIQLKMHQFDFEIGYTF